jgi:hypothetical protein
VTNPLNLRVHRWIVTDSKGFESHHPDQSSAERYAVSQSHLGKRATVDALVTLSDVESLIEGLFDGPPNQIGQV